MQHVIAKTKEKSAKQKKSWKLLKAKSDIVHERGSKSFCTPLSFLKCYFKSFIFISVFQNTNVLWDNYFIFVNNSWLSFFGYLEQM